MSEKRECCWCGTPFVVRSPADEECILCTMEIEAKQVPQMLIDMHWVYDNKTPQTQGQVLQAKLMRDKPGDFVERMTRLDREHRQRVAGLSHERLQKILRERESIPPASRQGDEQTDPDQKTQTVLELIDKILEEIKPDGSQKG